MEIYAEKLADIYDRIYHFKDYGKDVSYILNCIEARRPGSTDLLDVACGTGNHISGLSARFRIQGIDASQAMLKRAAAKFPETPFHLGDMTTVDLGRRFDVVTCLFRTISFVETVERFRLAILNMARHLETGGLLLVEPFFTPETYWIGHVKMNVTDQPDCKIAWLYVSEREGDVGVMSNHFLVGRPTGVEHFEEEHRMGLFRPSDYREAFDAAGLELEYDPVGPGGIGFYIGRRRLPHGEDRAVEPRTAPP
jgi:SAM-dependent methyltransferase